MPYKSGMTQQPSEHPLRRWRKQQCKTLEECASALGTSRQVMSDWERGKHKPGRRLMPRLREFTGGAVTADDFYPDLNEAA